MRSSLTLASLSLIAFIPTAHAATDAECQSLWKTMDVDANGALDKTEDAKGYIAAMQSSGIKLAKTDVVSRDEFLGYCRDKITDIKSSSPSNTKDFGKGDLTPGTSALREDDARKKLEANGYKNVRDLKLDDQGIWRGMADGDVKDKFVAVDAQGDIMADAKEPPGVKSDKSQPATSNAAAPAATTMAPPAGTMSPAMEPAGNVERGSTSTIGLVVWLFILIGNACALLFLNAIGGETSAMGGGPRDPRLM